MPCEPNSATDRRSLRVCHFQLRQVGENRFGQPRLPEINEQENRLHIIARFLARHFKRRANCWVGVQQLLRGAGGSSAGFALAAAATGGGGGGGLSACFAGAAAGAVVLWLRFRGGHDLFLGCRLGGRSRFFWRLLRRRASTCAISVNRRQQHGEYGKQRNCKTIISAHRQASWRKEF